MIPPVQLDAADEVVPHGAGEGASERLALGVGPLLLVVALGGVEALNLSQEC